QPRHALRDPGEDRVDRHVVEDVVADVGQQRAAGQPRLRLELRPEARLQDAGQAAEQDVAALAVRTAVAEGAEDLEAVAPGAARDAQQCREAARQVARPQDDQAPRDHRIGSRRGGRVPRRTAPATATYSSSRPSWTQRSISPPRLMSPRPTNADG